MSIAAILSDALERADMSQKMLAERVGVSQSYISQICAGKKIPTIATLARIGNQLDMSLLDFFQDEDPDLVEMMREKPREKLILNAEDEQIIRLYRSMDRRGRRVLRGIVSNM